MIRKESDRLEDSIEVGHNKY